MSTGITAFTGIGRLQQLVDESTNPRDPQVQAAYAKVQRAKELLRPYPSMIRDKFFEIGGKVLSLQGTFPPLETQHRVIQTAFPVMSSSVMSIQDSLGNRGVAIRINPDPNLFSLYQMKTREPLDRERRLVPSGILLLYRTRSSSQEEDWSFAWGNKEGAFLQKMIQEQHLETRNAHTASCQNCPFFTNGVNPTFLHTLFEGTNRGFSIPDCIPTGVSVKPRFCPKQKALLFVALSTLALSYLANL